MIVRIICDDNQMVETLEKFFCIKSSEIIDIDFLSVNEKTSDAEIENFLEKVDRFFVVWDVENINLAEKIAKFVEKISTVMALIFCPTAEDSRIAELKKIFAETAILPKNKIAEMNLEKNDFVCRAINVLSLFNNPSLVSFFDGLNFPGAEPMEEYPLQAKIICTVNQAAETLKKTFAGKSINGIDTDFLSMTEKTSDAEIKNFLSNAFWVFVVADAENLNLAKKIEAAADCLVTNMFLCPTADNSQIAELEKILGTTIIFPEDKISETNLEKNNLLCEIITSSINLIQDITVKQTAACGLDFLDIKDVMTNSGRAYIGIGEGVGENAPLKAIKNALKSPLLLEDFKNAKGILVDFVGGYEDISLMEVKFALDFFDDKVHDDADILWQANALEEDMGGVIKAVVVATRF